VYAVFRTGGKQYRASPGDRLRIERLDAEVGEVVAFDEVLLVGEGAALEVGSPLVAGGRVQGTVTSQGRGKKVEIIKFKRRAHYMRKKGHRQAYTEVQITEISSSAGTHTYEARARAGGAREAQPQESSEDSQTQGGSEE
jgi:large subunit ribosomal protein L21